MRRKSATVADRGFLPGPAGAFPDEPTRTSAADKDVRPTLLLMLKCSQIESAGVGSASSSMRQDLYIFLKRFRIYRIALDRDFIGIFFRARHFF